MSRNNIICIGCPRGCRILVESKDGKIINITGHSCPTGEEHARKEFTNPKRILPTIVKVKDGRYPVVSVKTALPISKKILPFAVREIAKIEIEAPVKIGQIICENLLGTGVDVVATSNVEKALL